MRVFDRWTTMGAALAAAILALCAWTASGCRRDDVDGAIHRESDQMQPAARATDTLLVNGGFENGGKSPTGWKRVVRGPAVDRSATQLVWDTRAHAGRRSLKVRHTDRRDVVKFAGWSTTLTGLTPNTWYEMAGRVRLADVDAGVVYLAIGNALSLPESGTADWKRVRAVTKTGPKQTSLTAQVQCRRFSGTAWFDDVSVVALRARPAGYPATAPKRKDEIVGVWMHFSDMWGVRPLDESPEELIERQPLHFDMARFRRDFRECFDTLEAMGVTDLYRIPKDAAHYRKRWGVDLAADELYLAECRRRGIRVFVRMFGWTAPPGGPGDIYSCRTEDGRTMPGACLTQPAVREHSVKHVVLPSIERIRRYRAKGFEIAGVYTDFIRWKSPEPCRCRLCRAEYAKVKARMSMNDFRCEQLTKYVHAARDELDKLDPGLMVVGAVKRGNSRRWGQDTPRWLREGAYDYIMPMCYGGPDDWVATIDHLTRVQGVDPKRIVMLTAFYYADLEQTVMQIALAKQRGLGGHSIWGWRRRYYKWPYVQNAAARTARLAEVINPPPRR